MFVVGLGRPGHHGAGIGSFGQQLLPKTANWGGGLDARNEAPAGVFRPAERSVSASEAARTTSSQGPQAANSYL